MNIGWPQGIILGLMFLTICMHASRNGERRADHYDLGTALMSAAITIGLLFWGGFFS